MPMFNRKRGLIVAVFGALLGTVAHAQTQAQAQTVLPPPEYAIKESGPRLGTNIREKLAWSTELPLNRRYHELTAHEKSILNAMYEQMRDGDEPPYPLDGMRPVVDMLTKAQAKLLVTGELSLLVDVDAAGAPVSVAASGSPSPEMTQFAASIFMLTRFKPALCQGQPCAMKYPFRMRFAVR